MSLGTTVALFKSDFPRGLAILSTIATITGSTFLLWFAARLKVVYLDGQQLYVSDMRDEVQVPLCDVGRITETSLTHPKTVTIELTRDSAFGRKVVFVPVGGHGFNACFDNKIASELRRLTSTQ